MGFDILIVGQKGRLAYEAALFAASLRHHSPRWSGRLVVAEPQPGPLWPQDPRIPEGPARALLHDLGAEIRPFESRHFGAAYPNGNKIEGLACLTGGPFLFFDSDTVITGELAELEIDFARPSASMAREGTWPKVELYGPGYKEIWAVLHARRGGSLADTLDTRWPEEDWRRYLYFNAGWFFGADPAAFRTAFLEAALMIRDDPPEEIAFQTLDPWLDQAALPLAIHELGGGRPGAGGGIVEGRLDGSHSLHYRYLPLAFATAPDPAIEALEAAVASPKVRSVLERHGPFRRFLYEGDGRAARALFDRSALPRRQQAIRNRLRREGLWAR